MDSSLHHFIIFGSEIHPPDSEQVYIFTSVDSFMSSLYGDRGPTIFGSNGNFGFHGDCNRGSIQKENLMHGCIAPRRPSTIFCSGLTRVSFSSYRLCGGFPGLGWAPLLFDSIGISGFVMLLDGI
ncbi:hypothetical protein AT5G24215 [Arabidopsis thaliana]|uniref:Uncharacterized protein n=1 Tax=Arabidopsis thaliana TaxID=3702 RepID=A0A1P8BDB6_ARATH|nr:uncharacterized protein AT5G24215 [Arabidopsis thaliana]ANM69551.1 hypothetical protein AT5G24215 [Arabidopsis thaliana]|eukprot:NP_001331220.1 hypothetical protein AT5G24215 [Arabidopsis thaliana]